MVVPSANLLLKHSEESFLQEDSRLGMPQTAQTLQEAMISTRS